MQNTPWILAILFFLLSIFLFYNFVLKGDGVIAPDGRIPIEISKEERAFILTEMRNFLIETKNLSDGIVTKDIDKIITSGTTGSGIIDRVPTSLMRKLPLSFKKSGFATQNKFKHIAQIAEKNGDFDEILKEYGALLKKCVDCHAKYKITEPISK